jgi:hypothetical protein
MHECGPLGIDNANALVPQRRQGRLPGGLGSQWSASGPDSDG